MKVYVVSYSSYHDGLYNEVKLFTDRQEAASAFNTYVDVICESHPKEDVWGDSKGGHLSVVTEDNWHYEVHINEF